MNNTELMPARARSGWEENLLYKSSGRGNRKKHLSIKNMSTGEIEIEVSEINILNKSKITTIYH